MAPLPSGTATMPDRPAREPVDVSQPWLINESKASAVTGLPVKRLRKHRMLGLDPTYVKIGRSVYYNLNTLFEYVARLPKGGSGVPARALNGARSRENRQ